MLTDGTYDVFVVDATPDHEDEGAIHLDLTIVAGEHKGEMLGLAARDLGMDELDLLGMPGTLVVDGGVPSFTVDT